MSADRDSLGRFLPGCTVGRTAPPGPGRPPRAKEEQVLRVLREAVTEEQLIGMVKACVDRALGGDVQALKLILSYLIGQPAQQVKLETGRVILVADGAGPFGDSFS